MKLNRTMHQGYYLPGYTDTDISANICNIGIGMYSGIRTGMAGTAIAEPIFQRAQRELN